MTIETVVQKSYTITIFGEHGRVLGNIPTNSGDMLMGYTATSVSVKKGGFINVYNERGAMTYSQPV